MSKTINVKVNNISIQIEEGNTILEAAKKINIKIPTLCHHDDLCVAGNCRVCVVEVKGQRTLQAACAVPVTEGMEIITNSLKVLEARRNILALLLSEHREDCLSCYKNGHCELEVLAKENLIQADTYINIAKEKDIDNSNPSVQKDDSKCIKCQRCVRTCEEFQGVTALTVAHKGKDINIETFLDKPLKDVECMLCGQCINRCPTGALVERNHINEVLDALCDTEKHVVVQTAPAVRVALGEYLDIGTERVTGKMVSALRALGFDSVFDTDFTADLTILEEGTEFLTRVTKALKDKEKVALPLMTSCSPGWINFMEHKYPDFLDNLSTCKSPQQMFGTLAKTFYAKKKKIDPKNMVVISIMPCTAKKYEADRAEMNDSGFKDVDYVLTTRELALMIQQAGIEFKKLENSEYDNPLGKSTGAAIIFGATGGVMEAALRTVYELVTGREVPFKNLDILPIRGLEGVKEAGIKLENCLPDYSFLEGVEVKIAIANGLANADKLMKQIKAGESPYHFIEIMACPGGCLGGGGQPIPTNKEIRTKRMNAIYDEDANMSLRKSHENPDVAELYKEFLKEPNSHKAHELLHTHYTARVK